MAESKYTEETVNKLCQAIADGNTHKVACALAGVSTTWFYDLMKSNSDFSDTVREAEATAEAFHVEQIRRASSTTWQASAWMLERRNNVDWGRKDRLDVTSDDEKIEGFKVIVVNQDETNV